MNDEALMPTNLKYRMLVSFCLMSLLPTLAATYVIYSILKGVAGGADISIGAISLVGLFSFLLSFLGFQMNRQIADPILSVKKTAQRMADGDLSSDGEVDSTSADEIQDLQKSLKLIARNAKDLADKVERLSFKDKLTGLYSATYIRERLDEEIGRAFHYQRPCAFAYVTIANIDEVIRSNGEEFADAASKQIAGIFNRHVGQFDRAACVGRGEFMIIFPDKNKKKCIEVVESIGADIMQEITEIKLCAGISENPIDGIEADSLYVKAQDRMKLARRSGKLLEAFA